MGNMQLRNSDSSGMGCGHSMNNDVDDNTNNRCPQETTTNKDHDEFSRQNINNVHKLPMDLFRMKLIEHFDILFQQNKIKWPRSTSNK